MRFIRVMCSGRVDLEFILKAFAEGQDGVFVGGCKLDECNYTTHGNYDAYATVEICHRIMDHLGIDRRRLRIQFMSGADGGLLAETCDDFSRQIRELGPLGKPEGIAREELVSRLNAARKLVPYIKLVERERLRVPIKSKAAYKEFFADPQTERLFSELIADQLTIGRMMGLLDEKPHSTAAISERLSLDPSAVARHISESSRQGLIKYDEEGNCYLRI